MKDKIQVKIVNRESLSIPHYEICNSSISNLKAREILDNLSYDKIKILINQGILVKNKLESTNITEVYDLVY